MLPLFLAKRKTELILFFFLMEFFSLQNLIIITIYCINTVPLGTFSVVFYHYALLLSLSRLMSRINEQYVSELLTISDLLNLVWSFHGVC